METRKSYTYLITFYDGSFYYGVRLCPKNKTPWQDTDYVGSPMTHKDKWNNTPFIKFILEVFDDYHLAREKEKQLIRPNLNNPTCLNEHAAGGFSRESCSKAGKISGEKAKESGHWASVRTFESRSKGGKTGGKNTSSQKWKCLVTGFISTPGPLSGYQKRRGIDTKLRERVN